MTDPGKTDSSVIGLLSSWVAPGPLQYRSVRLKEQPPCLLPTGKQTSKMEDEGLHCAPHRVPPALSGDWTTGSLVFLTFSSPTILHCILSVICFLLAVATARTPASFLHGGGRGLRTLCSLQGSQRPVFPVLRHFQPLTHLLVNYLYPSHKCSTQRSSVLLAAPGRVEGGWAQQMGKSVSPPDVG